MSETEALTEKRVRVERFIAGILERTGLPAELEIEEREGKGLSLAILPKEPGAPLGRGLGGALQVLASRVMNRRGEPRAWVTVGIGGHLPPKSEREAAGARGGDRSGASAETRGEPGPVDSSAVPSPAVTDGASSEAPVGATDEPSREARARSERRGRGEPAAKVRAPEEAPGGVSEGRGSRGRADAGAPAEDAGAVELEGPVDEVLAARIQALAERVERWGRLATVMALSEGDRRQALEALEGTRVTGSNEGGGALRRLRLKPSWTYRPPRAPEDE